ncbi:MAG: IS21-like element helper ATPase IstB [Deferrisomatales bacterium]|nr:IS21-like element helper ATPase IstB [Deferrisomatales bacterium]
MLVHPLMEQLTQLRLRGMRDALEEQLKNPQYAELPFEDRLGLLVESESIRRHNNRRTRRLQQARLKERARIEEFDFTGGRGVERAQVLELTGCQWLHRHLNVIVLGPTGAGKTFLACALGHAACVNDFGVRYLHTSRLLTELALARADGSYPKLLDSLAKTPLLILDDWLRDPLTAVQSRDLLEVLDDRYRAASTLLATQVPVDAWHERLADPTLADAILDRLVHSAYRLQLKGESRRKTHSPLTHAAHQEL